MISNSRWLRSHILALIALPAVVLIVVSFLISERSRPADLTVLCSNNIEACDAVTREFEERVGRTVHVVRLPTSEALATIMSGQARGEFDVWMGGPAESYVIAGKEAFLARSVNEPMNSIPKQWKDPEIGWYGFYGGILSLCVAQDQSAPQSWSELSEPHMAGRVGIPNPDTSGTASTFLLSQHGRLGSVTTTGSYLTSLYPNLVTVSRSGTDLARHVEHGRLPVAVTFDTYCLFDESTSTVVYPTDGTGFEIGAISVLDGTARAELAQSFVAFVVSDQGQEISQEAANQYPTSQSLDGDLTSALKRLNVPIYGTDLAISAPLRAELIDEWDEHVLGLRDNVTVLTSTLRVSLGAGLLSASIGGILALAFRFGSGKVFSLSIGLIPIIFPPLTWATILMYPPFNTNPYSWKIVALAHGIAHIPLAFVIIALSLTAIKNSHFREAASLGMGVGTQLRTFLAPVAFRGFVIAVLVASFVAATDPSVSVVYGGTSRYFASDILTGVLTGQSGIARVGLFVSIVLASIVSIPVSSMMARWLIEPDSSRVGNVRHTWAAVFGVVGFALAALIVAIIVNAEPVSQSVITLSTATVGSTVVLIGFGIGAAVTVFLPVRYKRAVLAVTLTLALSAQIAGGIVASMFRLNLLTSAGIFGPDTPLQGLGEVIVAQLLLVVPFVVLVLYVAKVRATPLMNAMRDAGGYSLRVWWEAMPELLPYVGVAISLATGLAVTRSAPAVFVDIGGELSHAPLALIDIANSMDGARVFAVSLEVAALVLIAVAVTSLTSHRLGRVPW